MAGSTLFAWTLVTLLGVLTPGIDTLLVLRQTLLAGRRAGLATVAGITLGYLVWATASLAGLTALLAASHIAYNVVRIVGAAYLIWLGGVAMWKSLSRKRQSQTIEDVTPAGITKIRSFTALRTGFVTNLLNPKVGVFYLSLLPQFLPTGPGVPGWGMVLVTIHVAVTFIWYPMLIWIAGKARRLLVRRRVRQWLDRITATVLIGIGLKLAVQAN